VLFTVLALAPGDPFSELATSPDVPPEVRAALRRISISISGRLSSRSLPMSRVCRCGLQIRKSNREN
jgi:hypothetical protein